MKKTISMLLAVIISLMPLSVAFSQDEVSDFTRGQAVGAAFGESYVSHWKILWGAAFGPLSLIYNFAVLSDPPSAVFLQMENESEEYMRGFISGYQEGFRTKSIKYNLVGWAATMVLYIIDYFDHNHYGYP
jgi:hypothetical protein